jgi:hypothetical protein
MSPPHIIIAHVRLQHTTKVRPHGRCTRLIDPISLSALPFCQGEPGQWACRKCPRPVIDALHGHHKPRAWREALLFFPPLSRFACAKAYPWRPVHFVVGGVAGSPPDMFAPGSGYGSRSGSASHASSTIARARVATSPCATSRTELKPSLS